MRETIFINYHITQLHKAQARFPQQQLVCGSPPPSISIQMPVKIFTFRRFLFFSFFGLGFGFV